MTVDNIKRVLVTGGAGFIGSNYVRYAVQHHPEWEVVVLDALTYAGNTDNLQDVKEKITFVQGDISNPQDVRTVVPGVDAILNFAAESHVDRSLLDSTPFVKTNVEGTLVLLEEARRANVRRFLHVSTDEVYGDLAGSTYHSVETDALAPRSPYSATKAGAEHLVLAYGISYGLDVVITRGSNTYGPYQYPEKIIPLFIANVIEGKRLPIYGDGSAVRDYLYVEDHCSGLDLVLRLGKAGQAYNLGARTAVTGLTVAQEILRLLDKPDDLIQRVPDRPGHDYRYAVDPSKTERMGWSRQWSFSGGLAHTVRWYLEHESWWRRARDMKSYKSHLDTWYERENG